MTDKISRRQALSLLAGVGASAYLGGFGCFAAVPTRPADIWQPEPGTAYALINATVIDVCKGASLTGKTVLVRDGIIQGVFDNDAPETAETQQVDCRGTYMIPGLINAHSHLNLPSFMNPGMTEMGMMRRQIVKNYEDAVCWGVTTVRDMGAAPKIIAADREAIERGEIPGPRVLTAMSFITCPNGYPDFSAETNWLVESMIGKPTLFVKTAEEARDAVKAVRDYGADLVKIGLDHRSFVYGHGSLAVLTDAQVDAIVNEAAKAGLRVSAHHLYLQGLERGLQFDLNTLEHVAMDGELTDDHLKKISDSKVRFVPTVTVGVCMAFKSTDGPCNENPELNEMLHWRDEVQLAELPQHCIPELIDKSKKIKRFYENEEYKLKKNRHLISFDPKISSSGLVTAIGNLRRLIEIDAIFGVGNDSGVPFNYPGMLHLEMELLHRFGMDRAKVLRAATMTNADICGLADKCGSIESGKWADLVFLAGNPLDDLKNLTKIKAVFKDGRLIAKADDFVFAPRLALQI